MVTSVLFLPLLGYSSWTLYGIHACETNYKRSHQRQRISKGKVNDEGRCQCHGRVNIGGFIFNLCLYVLRLLFERTDKCVYTYVENREDDSFYFVRYSCTSFIIILNSGTQLRVSVTRSVFKTIYIIRHVIRSIDEVEDEGNAYGNFSTNTASLRTFL